MTWFCFCGFELPGPEAERRAASLAHRASGDHERQQEANAIKGADSLGWSLWEAELTQADKTA